VIGQEGDPVRWIRSQQVQAPARLRREGKSIDETIISFREVICEMEAIHPKNTRLTLSAHG
jgi:hypothetical protein